MNQLRQNNMKRLFFIAAALLVALTVSAQEIVSSDTTVNNRIPSWRIGIQGGYAYRLGRVDKSMDQVLVDHTEKMKNGFGFSADATWYFMQSLGVGVKYDAHFASNGEYVTVTYDDGTQESGQMKENVNVWFLGPMVSYRALSRNMRHAFIMNLGAGYIGYKDNMMLIDPFIIKGASAGYLYELGYDFNISKNIAVGAMLTMISGSLHSYKTDASGSWEKVSLDEAQNLSHIGLSVGIRFNL